MNLFLLSIGNYQLRINENMEDRMFIPGSEWLYFKIYTGTKTADSILKKELYAFVKEMIKCDLIDRWFLSVIVILIFIYD